MDAFVPEGIRQLAGQGTGWLIATMLVAVILWLYRRLETVQTASETARELLHEKRLLEARETLGALNEVAKAQTELADAITARTETLKTIAALVTQIERDIGSQYEHWQLRVTGIERILEELRQRGLK
jgi:hypothetical protein